MNDGDNEVRASENPESISFTESDIYLDTDRPSALRRFGRLCTASRSSRSRSTDRCADSAIHSVIEQRRATDQETFGPGAGLRRWPGPGSPAAAARHEANWLRLCQRSHTAPSGPVTYDHFDGRDSDEQPHCEWAVPWFSSRLEAPWIRPRYARPSGICTVTVCTSGQGRPARFRPLASAGALGSVPVGQVNRVDFFAWSHEACSDEGLAAPTPRVGAPEARGSDPLDRTLLEAAPLNQGQRSRHPWRFAVGL